MLTCATKGGIKIYLMEFSISKNFPLVVQKHKKYNFY